MDKFNQFLSKHYNKFNILSNILIALGVVGFSVLGVFSNIMTMTALVFWGVWLALLYFVGKYLDEQLDDISTSNKDRSSCEID